MLKKLINGEITEKDFIGLYVVNLNKKLEEITNFKTYENHSVIRVNGIYYTKNNLIIFKKEISNDNGLRTFNLLFTGIEG